VTARVLPVCSDLLSALKCGGRFAVVVSNLLRRRGEWPSCRRGARPRAAGALLAGRDGLSVLRPWSQTPPGSCRRRELWCEIGALQGEAVSSLPCVPCGRWGFFRTSRTDRYVVGKNRNGSADAGNLRDQRGKRLSGTCRVSGAKNAVLPAMAASLLAEGPVEIVGAPRLRDIATFAKLLGSSREGYARRRRADGREVLRIAPGEARKAEAPYELVKTMRASVLVLGPLLARYGRARISLPGGCAIGARPIDQHLRGLELMGARTSLPRVHRGVGGSPFRRRRHFRHEDRHGDGEPDDGASLAEGTTVLSNAALEPEVCDLARLLRAMGPISRGRHDEIVVRGSGPHGARHEVMADRIEAATLLLAGAITAEM